MQTEESKEDFPGVVVPEMPVRRLWGHGSAEAQEGTESSRHMLGVPFAAFTHSRYVPMPQVRAVFYRQGGRNSAEGPFHRSSPGFGGPRTGAIQHGV